MTQPVAPGARAACFDESPQESVECSPVRPPSSSSAPWCSEGPEGDEAQAARAPPSIGPQVVPEPAGLRFCREADTVIEGFLCSEPTVVSNACRKPNNNLDAYICDEPRMHSLQNKIWAATEWIIRTVVTAVLGRNKQS